MHAAQYEIGSADEFAEVTQGWGLEWLQLDRGRLNGRIQQAGKPDLLLTRVSFNRSFLQRGASPSGMCTFGVLGTRAPAYRWKGHSGTANHVMVFPTNDMFEAVSYPGFCADTLSIPKERIRGFAEQMGLPDPLADHRGEQAIIESDQENLNVLRQSLTRLHSVLKTHDALIPMSTAIHEAECDALMSLVRSLTALRGVSRGSPEPTIRRRGLNRAVEHIFDHADQPPTIEEVCRASGSSWRTLNYAFRESFGITPKQFLEATRLQRARSDLTSSETDQSISEIAAHWGFWHMGKFAADYRRQFGELPSETRSRVIKVSPNR